jgi:hypothetical protein
MSPNLKLRTVLREAGWALLRPFFVFKFIFHNKKLNSVTCCDVTPESRSSEVRIDVHC